MMEEINALEALLERRFGGGVYFASFNIHYDDTEEIEHLVEHIWYERLSLPVTFIDEELCLQGYVDSDAIVRELEARARNGNGASRLT